MLNKTWLYFALATMLLWGAWGALTGLILTDDMPSSLVYSVWALSMIVPSIFVLRANQWKIEFTKRAVLYGGLIGLLGAGGQVLLFEAVKQGSSVLIFPIVSLSPLVTICLCLVILKEKVSCLGVIGIVLALIALPLFDYQAGNTQGGEITIWFLMALIIMGAWGLQAYFLRSAAAYVNAHSIFLYMTLTALLLVPLTWWLTPIDNIARYEPITLLNIGWIQLLNALGALCLVHAFRYGKALVVAPLTNAGAPLISSLLSMIIIGQLPGTYKLVAIVLAAIAAVILSIEPQDPPNNQLKP